jgi:methionine-rich copper-binding protein CopC
VTVTDRSGAAVNDGSAAIDPTDQTELTVKLKQLPAGTYTVKWHVLSVDTHTTEGDFTFQVGKG